MKRLITILVVSVLSVISTNSSAVAGAACDACKFKMQYVQNHYGEFSCVELSADDVVQRACESSFSSYDCSQTSSQDACVALDKEGATEEWCNDQVACVGAATSCPADCETGVTYQDMGNDDVRVTTTYCDSSTNYECRTKTETIAISNDNWFQDGSECAAGTCVDWDCKWTVAAGGTTCSNRGAGDTKPFCTCVMKEGTSVRTVAVRLWCNSTTNTGYNCNGVAGADDMDSSPLYCDLTYGTNAGTGICRYKKTCSTDCTNAWNLAANSKNYLYRLKGKCDYTTGSCVSNAGTVVGDFDYKCNHDNRAYETATTTTCKRMSGGKPTSCSGCKGCQTTTHWEDASNPAYQQQYHYNFSPISGTDRYQCVKTMDSLYQCNKGYYGNPGSSMTGCNACPTLASSGLTIVSQNENCSNRLVNTGLDSDDYWQLEVVGATTISQCYAMTGNQDDNSFCGATLNDGSGTFYWSDDYIKGSETVCFYQ